jgi:hypothetical protein
MHCVKLLGQSLMARDFDRQVAEIQTALPFSTATPLLAYLLLRLQAKSVRGKGKHVPHLICATRPRSITLRPLRREVRAFLWYCLMPTFADAIEPLRFLAAPPKWNRFSTLAHQSQLWRPTG